MKQEKSANKPPDGGDQKALVNDKDISCSLNIRPPPRNGMTPHLLESCFAKKSTQEVLAVTLEAVIDENWCLLDKKFPFNSFINGKYLSNISNYPNGQYICVRFNAGVTHTNKIGDLSRYSDPV